MLNLQGASAVLAALTPIGASTSYWVVVVIRTVTGVLAVCFCFSRHAL